MTAGCWAAPLTHDERDVLAGKLGRACRIFYAAARVAGRAPTRRDESMALTSASADMSDLHLDVMERAG
jgi:hypothetical protein